MEIIERVRRSSQKDACLVPVAVMVHVAVNWAACDSGGIRMTCTYTATLTL
jgi:hypothetical protein